MAKLYFRYGAMNCGKTANLLLVAHNYEEQGQNIIIFKPSIDTKGASKLTSRAGLEREVDHLLLPDEHLIDYIDKRYDAILIDEAQFLTVKQAMEAHQISSIGNIPILCYGLRADFQGVVFPASEYLLSHAESIEEMKTICKCGRKATHNLRKINDIPTFIGSQVAIDGEDKITYEAVCGECYYQIREQFDEEFQIPEAIKKVRSLERKNNERRNN